MSARNLLQRKTRSNVDKSDKQHSATPSASQHMVCTSRRACMGEAYRHATRIHRSCTSEFLSLRCSGQGLEPQGPFAQRFPKAHVKLDSFLPGCETACQCVAIKGTRDHGHECHNSAASVSDLPGTMFPPFGATLESKLEHDCSCWEMPLTSPVDQQRRSHQIRVGAWLAFLHTTRRI